MGSVLALRRRNLEGKHEGGQPEVNKLLFAPSLFGEVGRRLLAEVRLSRTSASQNAEFGIRDGVGGQDEGRVYRSGPVLTAEPIRRRRVTASIRSIDEVFCNMQ